MTFVAIGALRVKLNCLRTVNCTDLADLKEQFDLGLHCPLCLSIYLK